MPKKSTLWALALVLLVAFGLRAHRIAYDSVWWDEGVSVWMSRKPIPEMMLQTANDTHPPLSYIVLHGWMQLTGDEEFALRVLSVLFGVLTVAIAYRIGREVGGERVGVGSAMLTAAAALVVWWSQEIRMYAQATFFAALALWAALKLFRRSQHFWQWSIVLGLSIAGGLLSMYLFAGAVIALNLAFAVAWATALIQRHEPWKLFAGWAASQALALVFFVPWITFALRYAPTWSAVDEPISFAHVMQLYVSTVFIANATNIEQYAPLLIACAVLLVGAVALTATQGDKRVLWAALLICVVTPPALVYVLSLPRAELYRPTPSPRYFVMLAVPVYVLLAWGAARLNQIIRYGGTVALVGLLVVSGWSLNRYYTGLRLNDDYISMVHTIEALGAAGDVVVLNNDTDWPIFAYHFPYPFEKHITKTQVVGDQAYAADLLERYRNDRSGVWLVQTPYAAVTDPDNNLVRYLEERSWLQQRFDFPQGELIFFALNQERGTPSAFDSAERWPRTFTPLEVPIVEGVSLTGYTLPLSEVQAGNTIMVGVGWAADPGTRGEWPAAVQIIGPAGEVITEGAFTLQAVSGADGYQPVEVFIPPNAPTERVQVAVALGEMWQPLDEVRILPRTGESLGVAAVPESAARLDAAFGDAITLAAADLPEAQQSWAPGDQIPLTLYWRAEQPIPERYKVFMHLVGVGVNPTTGNAIWGQQDQEPRGGASPTTGWIPGAVIQDGYLIPISEGAPPGTYTLLVGLYDPLSGVRLPTATGDSVILMEVTIHGDE